MRAESRIAVVLVTGLLGGLGFFVQDRLKSETNSPDEELAQFLEPDVADGTTTSESEGDAGAFAPAADNDEPPRDLFTSDEYESPRPVTRTTTTAGSSAVSPNPFAQSTGVASVGASTRTAQTHPQDADPSSRAIAWADSEVTQASGTAPAATSQSPFASSAGTARTQPAGSSRGFTPNDLIAPAQTREPTAGSSSPTSDSFALGSPWDSETTQVAAAEGQSVPAPSTATQRPAQPVFYQTPAPSTPSNSGTTETGSQISPFSSPTTTNPPAAASDPFAPVQTNPPAAQANPSAQSTNPPTFNFSNPATTTQTQTPAQTTPAPALSPTPSNPFPTTTSSGTQQPSYNPQGLPNAPGGDPGTKIYEVAPGDNYWTISRKVYGAGRYFSALSEYNKPRIEDPELLAPGMIVLVPTPEILDQRYSEIISSPPPGVGGTAPAGFFVDAAGQPMYRVGEADTLSGIAQTYLGRSSRWVQIYGMNREVIERADALKPGTVLQLPPDAAPIALGPEESVIR